MSDDPIIPDVPAFLRGLTYKPGTLIEVTDCSTALRKEFRVKFVRLVHDAELKHDYPDDHEDRLRFTLVQAPMVLVGGADDDFTLSSVRGHVLDCLSELERHELWEWLRDEFGVPLVAPHDPVEPLGVRLTWQEAVSWCTSHKVELLPALYQRLKRHLDDFNKEVVV